MVGALRGTVHAQLDRAVLIDVHDVCYEVYVTPSALTSLRPGKPILLYTVTYQREEAPELYGFPTLEERRFFELLLTVSGVGPRGALGVMGLTSVEDLERAIAAGDAGLLTKVSGIGKKTAERIVIELKEKIGQGDRPLAGSPASAVFDALVRLGYTAREARTALRELDAVGTVEEQVRQALKVLGKR